MLNSKIDYDLGRAEILQMSNDAYYNLAFGEPCLDDSNYDEVEEIKARFPNGFRFEQHIETVENTDLIEATIVPICKCDSPFTHYSVDGKWFKSEFYYSPDKKQAYYRVYDMYHKKFRDYGWNDVVINQFGNPEIRPKGCIFPLYGNCWKTY